MLNNNQGMPNRLIDFEDDILIGDDGVILNSYELRSIETWTLSDFIEDMKTWADKIPIKKSGYRDLKKILMDQYQGLGTWLEYYLLEKRDLEERLYSDVYLCNLKPHADLLAASHDFIKRHFYPRQRHHWGDIATTYNHLWAFFIYSLFCRQVQEKLEVDSKAPKTKTDFLKRLSVAIHIKQECLENIEWEQNRLNSDSSLPGSVDYRNIEQNLKIKNSFQHSKKIIDSQNYTENKIFHLIMLQSQILSMEDKNFREHFDKYLTEWNIYRLAVKNSSCFQLCNLMPDGILTTTKKGRPIKPKTQQGKGRPPKGQSTL